MPQSQENKAQAREAILGKSLDRLRQEHVESIETRGALQNSARASECDDTFGGKYPVLSVYSRVYTMTASATPPPDLWQVMSDMDVALDIVEAFDKLYATYPGPDALVGSSNNIKRNAVARNPRARHAATIGEPTVTPVEADTVFSMARTSKEPVELQWAVMTALAIDSNLREAVAAQCPPAGAVLARTLPARFERYVMGAPPAVIIMTPHEAVCDFALRVEAAFTSVTALETPSP